MLVRIFARIHFDATNKSKVSWKKVFYTNFLPKYSGRTTNLFKSYIYHISLVYILIWVTISHPIQVYKIITWQLVWTNEPFNVISTFTSSWSLKVREKFYCNDLRIVLSFVGQWQVYKMNKEINKYVLLVLIVRDYLLGLIWSKTINAFDIWKHTWVSHLPWFVGQVGYPVYWPAANFDLPFRRWKSWQSLKAYEDDKILGEKMKNSQFGWSAQALLHAPITETPTTEVNNLPCSAWCSNQQSRIIEFDWKLPSSAKSSSAEMVFIIKFRPPTQPPTHPVKVSKFTAMHIYCTMQLKEISTWGSAKVRLIWRNWSAELRFN